MGSCSTVRKSPPSRGPGREGESEAGQGKFSQTLQRAFSFWCSLGPVSRSFYSGESLVSKAPHYASPWEISGAATNVIALENPKRSIVRGGLVAQRKSGRLCEQGEKRKQQGGGGRTSNSLAFIPPLAQNVPGASEVPGCSSRSRTPLGQDGCSART